MLPTITPHISGLVEGDPLRAYLDSLDKVAAFQGVTTVLPAHGHPFTDLPGRVEAIKEHHAERLELLAVASARAGWATVTELMQPCSASARGATWPRARPSPTSSTCASWARPTAAKRPATCSTWPST